MESSGPPAPQKIHSPSDLLLACEIFLFAAVVPLLLRMQLPWLESLLRPQKTRPTPNPIKIRQIVTYTDRALRLGWPLIRPGCLTRGLTLYYFLRRAGLDVTLAFGVANPRSAVVGHCWLVLDGQPYLERTSPAGRFTEVYRFSPDRHAIGFK